MDAYLGVRLPMETFSCRYLAYMLRLWRVDDESPVWRASLVDVRTGERHGFGSLELLFQFITERASQGSEACSRAMKSSDPPCETGDDQ